VKLKGRRFLATAVLGLTAGLLMTGPANAAAPAIPTHDHHGHHHGDHHRGGHHRHWDDDCWWEDGFIICDD
jgi:Spy/CpxP family protein refolding chaperone